MEATRATFSLRWKILLWFFVNLLVLSVAIFLFLRTELRLDINSLIAGPTSDRLEAIAGPLAAGLHDQPRALWPVLVERAVGNWRSSQVQAGLFRDDGTYLTGDIRALPKPVVRLIEQHERRHHGPMPWNSGGRGARNAASRPIERQPAAGQSARPEQPPPDEFDSFEPFGNEVGPGDEPPDRPGAPPPNRQGAPAAGAGRIQPLAGGPYDKFIFRTTDPARYWIGVHLGEMEQPNSQNQSPSVTLVFASDSLRGGGLLFDYYPWLAFAVGLVAVSVLIWLPFVTGVVGSLGRMMHTAEGRGPRQIPTCAHQSARGTNSGGSAGRSRTWPPGWRRPPTARSVSSGTPPTSCFRRSRGWKWP